MTASSNCFLSANCQRSRFPNRPLRGLVTLPPQVVVPVLAAARRVGADRLDVATRIGTDPDVFPRRRDHQRLDPGQGALILDRGGVRSEVAETATASSAPEPAAAGVAAGQPAHPVR